MNPSDLSDRLVPLCDGRPGLRGGLHVDVREPVPLSHPMGEGLGVRVGEGRGEGERSSGPTLDFISSDETLDRYDEIISAAGWKLSNYQRNPVFQNAHQYGDVIFTLGKALITEVRAVADRKALFQRIQFATDVNPMARIAYGLYKAKFLNAVSVGFIPIRWDNGESDRSVDLQRSADSDHTAALQRNADLQSAVSQTCSLQASESAVPPSIEFRSPQPYRRKYLEQELLEVSAVSIPANPNALALGLKSGAVEKSDLRDLAEIIHHTLDSPATAVPTTPSLHHSITPSFELLSLARSLRDILKHT